MTTACTRVTNIARGFREAGFRDYMSSFIAKTLDTNRLEKLIGGRFRRGLFPGMFSSQK
jgi:hypothetical protein